MGLQRIECNGPIQLEVGATNVTPYHVKLIYSSKVTWPLRLLWTTFPTHFNLQVVTTHQNQFSIFEMILSGLGGEQGGSSWSFAWPKFDPRGCSSLQYSICPEMGQWFPICIKFLLVNFFYKKWNKMRAYHVLNGNQTPDPENTAYSAS